MNEEQAKLFREQMEIRIVALLLGEASAFETAEIEEAMQKDSQLAAFQAQMLRTIELTREASKEFQTASQPAPQQPKLSPERREALFAKFRQRKPALLPISKPAPRRRGWFVPASIAAGLVLLIGSAAISYYRRENRLSQNFAEIDATEVQTLGGDRLSYSPSKKSSPGVLPLGANVTDARATPPNVITYIAVPDSAQDRAVVTVTNGFFSSTVTVSPDGGSTSPSSSDRSSTVAELYSPPSKPIAGRPLQAGERPAIPPPLLSIKAPEPAGVPAPVPVPAPKIFLPYRRPEELPAKAETKELVVPEANYIGVLERTALPHGATAAATETPRLGLAKGALAGESPDISSRVADTPAVGKVILTEGEIDLHRRGQRTGVSATKTVTDALAEREGLFDGAGASVVEGRAVAGASRSSEPQQSAAEGASARYAYNNGLPPRSGGVGGGFAGFGGGGGLGGGLAASGYGEPGKARVADFDGEGLGKDNKSPELAKAKPAAQPDVNGLDSGLSTSSPVITNAVMWGAPSMNTWAAPSDFSDSFDTTQFTPQDQNPPQGRAPGIRYFIRSGINDEGQEPGKNAGLGKLGNIADPVAPKTFSFSLSQTEQAGVSGLNSTAAGRSSFNNRLQNIITRGDAAQPGAGPQAGSGGALGAKPKSETEHLVEFADISDKNKVPALDSLGDVLDGLRPSISDGIDPNGVSVGVLEKAKKPRDLELHLLSPAEPKQLESQPDVYASSPVTRAEGMEEKRDQPGRKSAAAQLAQNGKWLFENGRIDDAEAKLNAAVKVDPNNKAARYYMDLSRNGNLGREENAKNWMMLEMDQGSRSDVAKGVMSLEDGKAPNGSAGLGQKPSDEPPITNFGWLNRAPRDITAPSGTGGVYSVNIVGYINLPNGQMVPDPDSHGTHVAGVPEEALKQAVVQEQPPTIPAKRESATISKSDSDERVRLTGLTQIPGSPRASLEISEGGGKSGLISSLETNLIHTSKSRESMSSKLDSIRLDHFQADGLPLTEVVKRLDQDARKHDSNHLGVNFLYTLTGPQNSAIASISPGTGLPAAPPMDSFDLGATTVNIPPLTNVTLREALDAVQKAADRPIKYSVEDYAVVLSSGIQKDVTQGPTTPGQEPSLVKTVEPETQRKSVSELLEARGQFHERQALHDYLSSLSRTDRRKAFGNLLVDTGGESTRVQTLLSRLSKEEAKLKMRSQSFGNEEAPVDATNEIEKVTTELDGIIDGYLKNIKALADADKVKLEALEARAAKAEAEATPAQGRTSQIPPTPQPEINTRENAFSTFSLNVSDVSFKLAAASLENSVMPEPASIRVEEFVNAFNYHDPAPQPGQRLAFAWERAHYPFAHNRDMLRFAIQTAARGREAQKPLNLVILLDNSGSMERSDRVQIVRQAMEVLARQLQPQDRISIVAFARTARLWVDGMAGGKPGELLQKVLDLNPDGGTNLEDALGLGYATAAKHFMANGINRVILLTDGAANLGNVEPEALKQKVVSNRIKGIALDCFGIGWEGYNDDLLEVLSHNGDGRYGFLNHPEEAAPEFANQLAGALNVEAADVKTQVEFNPSRVPTWRQIGYAKHQLTKEQFRDNTVDAAELAASESGNALYAIEVNPEGSGPIGVVRVRYKIPSTGEYVEQSWTIPYQSKVPALDQAGPAMRLATTAGAFGEWLSRSPYAGEVTPATLQPYLNNVAETYSPDPRPQKLAAMLRQAQAVAGK